MPFTVNVDMQYLAQRKSTTNPLAAALQLVAAPLNSLRGFRDGKAHQQSIMYTRQHIVT